MSYTPYAPPAATATDPTNVMGRRIGAFLVDFVAPLAAAFVIGIIVFMSAATSYPHTSEFDCNVVRAEAEARGETVGCVQSGDRVYVASQRDTRRAIGIGGLFSLLVPLNLFVLQGITGASVGKLMFGIRVVRANGEIAGFGWNLLRTLLLFLAVGVSFLCGLGMVAELIVASVTHPHRRVGDMAAGTYVVRKDAVGVPIAAANYQYVPYAPPVQQAPTGFAPGTYGTSLPPSAPPQAQPPASTVPTATWGTAPASAPTTPAATPAPSASPAPAAAPARQQQAARQQPQPQWDASRNAWICWDPARGQWLQWDASTSQWRPL